MKILFLIPYPLAQAPSQRFRFEQYFDLFTQNSIDFEVNSYLDSESLSILYKEGNTLRKVIAIFNGLFRRLRVLFKIYKFEFIFIHREVIPVGPPVFEWIIAKVFLRKIIFDFDDAIWLTDKNESFFETFLRWRSKTGSICKWSYKVSCGNEYLQRYALQFNRNSLLNPTTIDTSNQHTPFLCETLNHDRIVIGWTGSHSTLKYLYLIEHVLQELQQKYKNVDLMVIADHIPNLQVDRIIFKKWNKVTEIEDLCLIDIGIMPLPDDEWAQGKCGFKALQYMAMQIPAVCSPVGVNNKIIQHSINGFLCHSHNEWTIALEQLIKNKEVRNRIGIEGRKTVIESYSVGSNKLNFLSLFQ